MEKKLPKGPRNRKKDLPSDWFKGKSRVFLTSAGTPVGRVQLQEFSAICGVKVVPGRDL